MHCCSETLKSLHEDFQTYTGLLRKRHLQIPNRQQGHQSPKDIKNDTKLRPFLRRKGTFSTEANKMQNSMPIFDQR